MVLGPTFDGGYYLIGMRRPWRRRPWDVLSGIAMSTGTVLDEILGRAGVLGFQVTMTAGDLIARLLLIRHLRALGQAPQRALIYLWSPLAIFETAHAAHVDGLVLPFLVGALLATACRRPVLAGALLGVATSCKLYTGVLLPALWHAGASSLRVAGVR